MADSFIFIGYYIKVPDENGLFDGDSYQRFLSERKYDVAEYGVPIEREINDCPWYLYPSCEKDGSSFILLYRGFEYEWLYTSDVSALSEKQLEKPHGTYERFAEIKRTDFYKALISIWSNAEVCWGGMAVWL